MNSALVTSASDWVILIGAALVGSTVGGVAGFGAGVILLPIVVAVLGLKAAIPVMTVTMLVGNLSRVWWSRGDIDARVVVRFLAGAAPATAAGAVVFTAIRLAWLSRIIGAFLLLAVPLRRILERGRLRMRLAHFPLVGAAFGFLSSLVVTTGPAVTPFFLAYGLRRGAYLGTEATCAMVMHIVRAFVLARYALLSWDVVLVGAVLGSVMFGGSWMGRRLVDRMSERMFTAAVEVLLLLMGLKFLLLSR